MMVIMMMMTMEMWTRVLMMLITDDEDHYASTQQIVDRLFPELQQRHKKTKLSGRQNFQRNFFFRTECINRFRDIHAPKVQKSHLHIYVPKERKMISRHTCQSAKSARYEFCNNTAKNEIFIVKVFRLFGSFPDSPESFQTVRTLYESFPHCRRNFQTIWKLFGPTRNFPDRLKAFQNVWKLSRLSGLETFRTVWKVFQTVRKLSRLFETG